MLPLYIFEPRYRLMLARALEGHRMFAVGLCEDGQVAEIGGAGVVRACVGNEDGTSNLVLQGVCRVRFSEWSDAYPFPDARVEPLTTIKGDSALAKALRREILDLLEGRGGGESLLPAHVFAYLERCEEAEVFCDLASSCLVADAPVRYRLLEEEDLVKRLEILAAYLSALPAFGSAGPTA
jgi:ATP-dependent Lon protease